MNNAENPLIALSSKSTISQDALESLKLKLSALYISADYQNEESSMSMYQKFLEFIIEISQCLDPSMYVDELTTEGLLEAYFKQDNTNNRNLESIKTILVGVLQENILDSEDLECLWRLMRKNIDISSTVFEILSRSANESTKEIFTQNMIFHILNTPINHIKDSDYTMTSRIFEICKESSQLLYKQFDSFWQALSNTQTFNLEFVDVLKKVTRLIKGKILTADNKKHILCIWVENIGKEKLTLISIRSIRKLIESYPKIIKEKNELTRTALVRFLCKEKDLLNKVIKELELLIVKDSEDKDQKFFQANEMKRFIRFLTISIPGCNDIITYDAIISLLEIGFMAGDVENVQWQLFLLTKQIIESKIDNDLDIEELVIFFQDMTISSKYWKISKFTKEAFDCFRTIFIIVNQYIQNISEITLLTSHAEHVLSRFEWLRIRKNESYLEKDGDFLFQVDALPHKLEGYTLLWEIAYLAEDQSVASDARDLLIHLHTNLNISLHSQVKEIRAEFLSLCFRHLKEISSYEQISDHRIMKCLELLHSFIDHTSKDNPERPMLHSELSPGELLTLTVKEYYYSVTSRIRVNLNTLVSNLLHKLRQKLKINSFLMYIEEQSSKLIISETQNTRTLGDLGIKNNTTLVAKPRVHTGNFLIQYDNTLNPQAKLIFTTWFDNFSDNQKMSPQQCADFFQSCTNQGSLSNDRRIVHIFAKHDDDKDGYLTLDNFLKFYHDACIETPIIVWQNLLAIKEAPDLKLLTKTQERAELSADLNVASLISSNPEYIQVLFYLLESKDEIAVKALQLLNRLPTEYQTFADIVMLKGVRDILDSVKPDWRYVLDMNNIYKLFYCMNIVEYLTDSKRLDDNEDKDEVENMKRLWSQDAKLLEYKKSWFSDFVACGGFGHLNDVLDKLRTHKTNPNIETYIARIKYLIGSS